jgi:hypothetical protein
MKFEVNMHTQILNVMCSLYEEILRVSTDVHNVHFPGKRDDSNFAGILLHNFVEHDLCTQFIFYYRRS